MARLLIEGFGSSNFSIWTSSSLVSGGAFAGYAAQTGVKTLGASISKCYMSAKIYIYESSFGPQMTWVYFKDSNGVVIGTVITDSSRYVKIYKGTTAGTLLGTSVSPLSLGIWYLFECYYEPLNNYGKFQVKLNGVTILEVTGDIDTTAGLENILSFGIGPSTGGQAVTSYYMDDVVFDDAGWIGNSYIQLVVPTGVGATAAVWTPSTGANWSCVDEIPASDTDYIKANVAGYVDTYGCNNLTGTIGSVKAVRVMARYAYEGTPTPTKQKIAILVNGTNYYGDNLTPALTYQYAEKLWELNPNDAAAWEDADISALEIGMATVA